MIMRQSGPSGISFTTAEGLRVPRFFTPETPSIQVEKFHTLLISNETTISAMCTEYYDAITLNGVRRIAGEPGKDWPIFGRLERLLNRLQREAGIIDS